MKFHTDKVSPPCGLQEEAAAVGGAALELPELPSTIPGTTAGENGTTISCIR